MKSQWKIWCETKNINTANNLLLKVKKQLSTIVLDETLAPYEKGGFVISFWVNHPCVSWNDYVVEVIALGQSLGRNWGINGDITQQVDGWSNESSIPGIQSIQWMCDEQFQA